MATTQRKEAFLATLEFILDSEGRKHYVYPMKLRDLSKTQELFSKINDDLIILNMPSPLIDDKGNLVLSEDGEEIINDEPYIAMMEVLEMALNESQESIESWIDIGQIEEILAKYRKISGLLQKKQAMEQEILSGQ